MECNVERYYIFFMYIIFIFYKIKEYTNLYVIPKTTLGYKIAKITVS